MDVEAIDTSGKLEAIQPEWDLLWERCPSATPFQYSGWLLPWWRIFGSGELFTFAVRSSGRLIGLAPFFLHPWNGRQQVTFIGNGVSDYLDLLCESDAQVSVWAAVAECIAEQRHRWDLCDLQDLRCHSALLNGQIPAGLQAAVQPQYVCSVINLPETVKQFEAALPHGLRRNLRRYLSQLQTEGRVEFETAGVDQYVDQYSEHVDALVVLHRARWSQKHDPGMLGSSDLELFHRTALVNLRQNGLVRLHALRLDRRILAIVYAWVHRGRAYSYLGGFDPALARFSPGALIMKYTIDQAIDERVRVFDFLRGSESYKAEWGARPELTSRLLLWHERAPSDLLESSRA